MLFLTPNQQCQSTEDKVCTILHQGNTNMQYDICASTRDACDAA